ncbi:MAG: phosphoethanolamine--lipid A transferase [Rhodoferax sp.]|uniref:phosphoethanolamine transferase n=1 Tax=Rhodoferax sp. TaxID=50421 RepID=UPI001B7A8057|nr:phosphoethanolamine--lipid A transferase [Rhodoferax sp.]MBP9905088.1 phosphoethanolamine--lipid A transferase [Rhodoferax sp.]
MLLAVSARTPWHPVALLLILALWLATVGNIPLWSAIWRLPETHGWHALVTVGSLGLAVLAVIWSALCLLLWPRWLKPAGLLFLIMSAAASFFMQRYGVVIDPSMIANVAQTDAREVLDLLSWSMLLTVLLGVVLPAVWLWRQPLRQVAVWSLMWQQMGVALLALLLTVALLWLSFQDLASLMRNHKSLRYMINPFNSVYAITRHTLGQAAKAQQPLLPLGEDARLTRAAGAPDASPLIVVVVGETARAANFGLGGYARDTTPRLRELQSAGDLAYFSDVSSCGTNTQTSVPCMFSHLGRSAYQKSDVRYENMLDVLQRAGLAVLWMDNQSGCKGVCDRVPERQTSDLKLPDVCGQDGCFDEVMLRELATQLDTLDPQRRARGTVVVLHQMGSHGPAYFKRSPAAFKRFQPECTSNALQDCQPEQLVNTYDNSIVYTDHFLAEAVHWLKTQASVRPTALLYMSDHGESLGEKGLYLHGMPYSMAPKEQTHVPMVLWLSPAMQRERGWHMDCVRQQAQKPWSHDNLFHTVVRMAGVATQVVEPQLDVLAACSGPAG